MKKEWQKPKLIILYRGRPDEAVLTHCKHKNVPPVNPASYHDDCNGSTSNCGACSSNKSAS